MKHSFSFLISYFEIIKGVTCLHLIRLAFSAILIQIVMVSPGTHVVKNFESLSITTNESEFRKTSRPKLN